MSIQNLPAWLYAAFLLAVLVIAGIAEYLKIAPANTFYTVFLIVIGLVAPSPLFGHAQTNTVAALQQNTAATNLNTQVMSQPAQSTLVQPASTRTPVNG